ncbi:MAG: hypothetical protein IJX46_09925 [Clostridia bacterium]|nr:hypothetical protein [Clostridia bacterium]
MKKLLALFLSAIFAVTPLWGCGESTGDTEPPKTTEPPNHEGEEPQKFESARNPYMIPEPYLTLFKENGSIELDGREIRINDYRFPSIDTPLDSRNVMFYTIDMDGDGEYELILHDYVYYSGDKLLLREDGGKIKGYSFSDEEMNEISVNGNFFRFGDNLYSVVRLKFTEDGIEYVELARREGAFGGEKKYFIGGEEVTEEEYENYDWCAYAEGYALNPYLEAIDADLDALIDIFERNEEPVFYNFINENEGYFFAFEDRSSLEFILKTEDGGNSWTAEELWSVPSIGYRESIICAEMINEKIGFIFASCGVEDNNFSSRTYITVNGGKTWEGVALPSRENTDCYDLEAYDLRYEGGEWILCCKAPGYAYTSSDEYVEYTSPDLKNWTYCEKARISTERFKNYSDIIETMTAMLDGKKKEDFDVGDNAYDKEILGAIDHSKSSWSVHPLCYSEKDINADGVQELLILDSVGTLLSLFTMTEKGPRTIGEFVSLGTANYPVCVVGSDGKLYLNSYGRYGTSDYRICTIAPDGDHLDVEYGISVYVYDEHGKDVAYYGHRDNQMFGITGEEFNSGYSEHGFNEIFNTSANYDCIKRLNLEISYFPGMTPQGK